MQEDKALNAEESVLGSIFIKPDAMDDIATLEPRDFISETHANLFKVLKYMYDNDKPIDIVTVVSQYQKYNRMEDSGGISYITSLATSAPSAANIKYYADIVRSKALRRRGEEVGAEIKLLSKEDITDDEEYFSKVESLAMDLRPKVQGKMVSVSEGRESYFKSLKEKPKTIKTGDIQFDTFSGGLGRQDLFISAGRPGAGKTARMIHRAINVAKQNEGPVLIYSQEMSTNQLKDRMMSSMSGVPFSRINKRNLKESDLAAIDEAHERLESLPIYIQDTAAVTIDEVRATARQFKREHGRIATIFIDYLQIMKIPQKKEENRAQAIGVVTGKSKQLARELDTVVYMLCQLKRADAKAKNTIPSLEDLKESGSIEQDADVVELLYYDSKDSHEDGEVVTALLAKGRNIGTNQFKLIFKGWLQQFHEIPKKKVM